MFWPSLRDDAQAVAVAVEGQAQLGVGGLQRRDHVAQVVGLARVGWWFGKLPSTSVNSSITSQPMARRTPAPGAGHAVAAVDHDLHRPRQPDVAHDARGYAGNTSCRRTEPPARRSPVAGLHHAAQAWMSSP
jgi:hypothetical protein